MKLEEILNFYEKNSEVVGTTGLLSAKSKRHVSVYVGFEISGEPHLGTYLSLKRAESFLKAKDKNVEVNLLLADFHSFLNNKDVVNNKQKMMDFFKAYKNQKSCLISGFLESKQSIKSGFQQKEEYWKLVFEVMNRVPLKRLERCMTKKSKEGQKIENSELLYVVLQVVDMIFLSVDIAIGGIDQRKIHMLYKDIRHKYFKKQGNRFKEILFIHHNLICDKNGKKISKSEKNYTPVEKILANLDAYPLEKEYLEKNCI